MSKDAQPGGNAPEEIRRRLEQVRERLKAAGGRPVLSDEEWRGGSASVRRPGRASESPGREGGEAGVAPDPQAVEPLVDVFDEAGHVTVLAETPGIGQEDLEVEASADRLVLATKPGARRTYRKEVGLPTRVDPQSLHWSCRNGILEARLAKREGAKS